MPRRSRCPFRPATAAVLLLLLSGGAPVLAGAQTSGTSLAPVNVDQFRERYGQEALFRLRLGVDSAPDPGASCTPPPPAWPESIQFREYERQLAAGAPYEAGRQLGGWQRWQRRCGAKADRSTPPADHTPVDPTPMDQRQRSCADFAALIKRLRIEARFTGRSERLLRIYNEKLQHLTKKYGFAPCPQVAYPLPL